MSLRRHAPAAVRPVRRADRMARALLFVSLKTVETHLRNIFRELSASSRIELAPAVERAERMEPATDPRHVRTTQGP